MIFYKKLKYNKDILVINVERERSTGNSYFYRLYIENIDHTFCLNYTCTSTEFIVLNGNILKFIVQTIEKYKEEIDMMISISKNEQTIIDHFKQRKNINYEELLEGELLCTQI